MREQSSHIAFHTRADVGVTLMELMVAMAAGLVVLGATFQAVIHFQQQYEKQHVRAVRHQDLRLSLELLEQELRMAGSESISVATQEEVHFTANVHDLMTTVTTTAMVGQSTISVEDGRGWNAGKTIVICAVMLCETFTLARDSQRSLLFLSTPLSHTIPAAASVSVTNHVRYYTHRDEGGDLNLMRMVDGGASLLVDDIQSIRFSYWNERGLTANNLLQIKRIVIEVLLRGETIGVVREVSI